MRLIDADAAVAEWYRINDIDENDRGARFVGYTEIPRWLYHIPTIDAEPVVRCIDCIFWYDCEYPFKSENGFCCCGEREEP